MAFKKLISIQMDLMYITFLQCLHPRCWVLNSPFVGMNISLLFLLRMQCFALTNYVCMMSVWQKWHELVHVRAVECSSLCILMFFCSYVFYLLLLSALADIVLSLRLDPWSWPGMTVSGALVAFCGCLLVFRHKNKSFTLNIKCAFKHAWCSFDISMLCIFDAVHTYSNFCCF